MRPRPGLILRFLFLSLVSSAASADLIELRVQSGSSVRIGTPIRVAIDTRLLGGDLVAGLSERPMGVRIRELSSVGDPIGMPFEGQLDLGRTEDRLDQPTLTFLLHGTAEPQSERRFEFDPSSAERVASPWRFSDPAAGRLDLKHGDQSVFRYNMTPVSDSRFPEIPSRDAYLHPAYTPSGALITGDFMTSHPHHRGFFLAYTKTLIGENEPDFWNYQKGSGKIRFEKLDAAITGPVTATIRSSHRWEAAGEADVMKERWEIEIYDVPDSPYWLFDLTSRQRAIEKPIELIPYRYGGMAYRGPEPFYHGKIDVLTSEGLNRVTGDQKPARWVDMTGPVEEGSSKFGGAMILDHPSNPHHPTVVRIHPTTIPFFTYTPGHDTKLTIGTERDTVFRYRIVIHDGHPDRILNERLWRDFAAPPIVTVVPKVP